MKATFCKTVQNLREERRRKKKDLSSTQTSMKQTELSKAGLKERPSLSKASLKENGVQEKWHLQ